MVCSRAASCSTLRGALTFGSARLRGAFHSIFTIVLLSLNVKHFQILGSYLLIVSIWVLPTDRIRKPLSKQLSLRTYLGTLCAGPHPCRNMIVTFSFIKLRKQHDSEHAGVRRLGKHDQIYDSHAWTSLKPNGPYLTVHAGSRALVL